MKANAEAHIHLRARAEDRALIDRAAALAGTNRSDFMLSSALREARNLLIDRTNIEMRPADFNKLLAWLDKEPTTGEAAGMKRLLSRRADWVRE